ncbi:MAG TPA: lysophospholipid acyltransferase family protein [Thermomicrobiales bacterium]|nr:lysophospholipid acyltransferase family protein [Thermomicrobiales bacterium]
MRHPRIAWALCVIITRLIARPRLRGAARLPDPDAGPCVVACRHISWIDPLLIVCALGPRRPVVFLAAREHVERHSVLRHAVRWLGAAILVERGAQHQRDVLRAAQNALARGVSVALFPEGRINVLAETGETILELEPGAAVIARRSGVPILPLSLSGSDGLHFGRRVEVVVGEPLPPGASRPDDGTLTALLRERLLALTPPDPPPSRWQPGRWLSRLN